MKTPLTRASLMNHFAYNWWKYLLVLAAAFFIFGPKPYGLLYSRASRVPAEKEITFYVYGQMNEQGMNEYMENVRSTQMDDMESMIASALVPDDSYGPIQLTTYAAAGEGNVYLLPRDTYLTFASSGLCAALEEDEELMAILDGVDLQRGWKKNDAGENHICGIPQDKLPGLSQYAYADNGFLCVLVTNKNPENTMKFFRIFCRDMLTAPVQIQE